MAAAPKNNLPPESQPWARYVEEQVRDLKTKTTVIKSGVNSTAQATASSSTLAAEHEVTLKQVVQRANEQDIVIESIGITADGKNTITRSEDPAPTGVTLGTDGDLWQQFLGTQIIAQWTHNGTEYVSATLSHEVISSIDLGTATVGALTGAVIQTAESGARIELTSDHFRKYDASENIEVDIPVGGTATFSGVITGSDVVGATIQTALTGPRIVLSPANNPSGVAGMLEFYTDNVNELSPGFIHVGEDGSATWDYGFVEIRPPKFRRDDQYTGIIFESLRHASDPLLDTSNLLLNASTTDISGKLVVKNIERFVGSDTVYKGVSYEERCFGRDIYILDSSLASGFGSFADFDFFYGYEPTVSDPYFAWDVNTTRLLYTTNGTTWTPIGVTNLSGTYAARPVATTVPVGTLYYCTNIPETYRSDGSAWVVVGSGGSELGYAEILTTVSTTSATAVDVSGLSITTVVGERPIKVVFDGPLRNTTAGAYARVLLVVDDTAKANGGGPSTGFDGRHRELRVSDLTPGTEHTFKIQLVAPTGGTASIAGDPVDPAFIQVVTV